MPSLHSHIKAAHKTVRVRPRDSVIEVYWEYASAQMFLLQCLSIWRYIRCSLVRKNGRSSSSGATRLIFMQHILALYADDLLGFQFAQIAQFSFRLTLVCCATFNVPLSWKSCSWVFAFAGLAGICMSGLGLSRYRPKNYKKLALCIREALRGPRHAGVAI